MNSLLKKLQVEVEGGVVPDRWINNDIKPIEADRRTWGFWTFHNFCKSTREVMSGGVGRDDAWQHCYRPVTSPIPVFLPCAMLI
jgi:hypothetical protein